MVSPPTFGITWKNMLRLYMPWPRLEQTKLCVCLGIMATGCTSASLKLLLCVTTHVHDECSVILKCIALMNESFILHLYCLLVDR